MSIFAATGAAKGAVRRMISHLLILCCLTITLVLSSPAAKAGVKP
jgi:hypothetical protein